MATTPPNKTETADKKPQTTATGWDSPDQPGVPASTDPERRSPRRLPENEIDTRLVGFPEQALSAYWVFSWDPKDSLSENLKHFYQCILSYELVCSNWESQNNGTDGASARAHDKFILPKITELADHIRLDFETARKEFLLDIHNLRIGMTVRIVNPDYALEYEEPAKIVGIDLDRNQLPNITVEDKDGRSDGWKPEDLEEIDAPAA